MGDFTFSALGTKWSVSLDGDALTDREKETVLNYISGFERRFSRFLPDSEVNAFRNVSAGKYEISEEFSVLLGAADRLRALTEGVYDPAVAGLLERAGYDASYAMEPRGDAHEFVLPKWSLSGRTLILEGPAAFDLGGTAKGYCIDEVAALLVRLGRAHFIVDGGGDMRASSKKDGSSWKVAIQYPGKPDTAAGIVDLKERGIAVSDSFRRRWGKWHHIVHPHQKRAIERIIGAVAVVPSAWQADCMTSALYLARQDTYAAAAREYGAEYLVFNDDDTCLVSPGWKGELFT